MSLDSVWERLGSIQSLTFVASSSTSTGWNGSGEGAVEVTRPSANEIIFSESGTWTPDGGKELTFTNSYRWTKQSSKSNSRSGNLPLERLRLEHLRFGADHPVHLFDLAVDDNQTISSVDPHV